MRVGGNAVALERKSLEVLLQLLYRAGEVVTKEELLEAVWPGRIVSESVPAKCVSRIREVLGDDEQNIIKTVHGYGYRLTAAVTLEQTRSAPAIARLDLAPGGHPPLRPLWSLVRRLGAGGQGEVWLVRHDKTPEQRVFKFALDLAGLSAIKREITLYRYLRDTLGERSEFVELFDWNLEEPPYFIELEYAGGGNLAAWGDAQGGLNAVSLELRLEIVARIADALAAAHSVGVLHKDLKPSNVLIVAGGDGAPTVKLTDFGSGGLTDPALLERLGITRLGFTKSVLDGDAGASTLYIAPEVLTGQPATVQADMYSLGVVLYQIVVGDLKRPLAPGWELGISDPLLCDDIASAVAGDPARRLRDPSELATRLRSLDERRRRHALEQAEKLRLEQERQAAQERARKAELAFARLRARRNWMLTALATLIVGFSLSVSLYAQARRAERQAEMAAASSKAVADFLSKDLFAQVGSRPLRDLTVPELLETASDTLAKRPELMPEAAAEIHAALGSAFWTMERVAPAERHLGAALERFEALGTVGTDAAVAAAAQLLGATYVAGKLPADFTRYEAVVAEGGRRLGPRHPRVLALRQQLAWARFFVGDWRLAAAELRNLVNDEGAHPDASGTIVAGSQMYLARVLLNLHEFADAEKVMRDCLPRMVSLFGPSHIAVAQAHAVLAQALGGLEQFKEAGAELERSLELIRPWVANDSAQLLSVHYLRGQLLLQEGRVTEAVTVLEDVLGSIGTLSWMQKSDQSAELRWWLGRAYLAAGRLDAAASTMSKAVEISGAVHPYAQITRVVLAEIELRRSGPASARKILAAVNAEALAKLGTDNALAGELHRVEGLVALAEGRRDAAETALREALRISELRYGSRHSHTQRARSELPGARPRPG